jgi:Tfp pilus assembly protein PilW
MLKHPVPVRSFAARRPAQAGLSIVELLVGVAIGLVVVAAAALMVSGQLFENRRLLIETQLQQDLRATADIITRDIRRVGALPEERISTTPGILDTIYADGAAVTTQVARNLHYLGAGSAKIFAVSGGAGANQIIVPYTTSDRQSSDVVINPYGFRLTGTTIQSRLPGSVAQWQDLTDPRVMQVTSLTITRTGPASVAAEVIPCPKLCSPGNDTACWPRVRVHEVTVAIEANATADPNIRRVIRSQVRLRNEDVVTRSLTATTYEVCPP